MRVPRVFFLQFVFFLQNVKTFLRKNLRVGISTLLRERHAPPYKTGMLAYLFLHDLSVGTTMPT